MKRLFAIIAALIIAITASAQLRPLSPMVTDIEPKNFVKAEKSMFNNITYMQTGTFPSGSGENLRYIKLFDSIENLGDMMLGAMYIDSSV